MQSEKSFHVNSVMTAGLGTPIYMAPELLGQLAKTVGAYNRMVDVYSFGIILYETQELTQAWSNCNLKFTYKIFQRVEKGERPPLTDRGVADAPDGFTDLLKACWAQHPDDRPEFEFILETLRDMQRKTGGAADSTKLPSKEEELSARRPPENLHPPRPPAAATPSTKSEVEMTSVRVQ